MNKIKTPNIKPQTPEKLQIPSSKVQRKSKAKTSSLSPTVSGLRLTHRWPAFRNWSLVFLWCLELGVWCFFHEHA